ncbi:MAG: DUF1036 domain-containing protein [Leptolyngbyaceae cyanobacterium HOT.MB2.61]|jgi:uncharacterized membrane protein|nr:DUF1036 domain-containing protein [Leptolyngbyaceae cyanobacterium HOT.MB2.61]
MDKPYGFTVLAFVLAAGTFLARTSPADASLDVCNNSTHVAYVAVGYSLGESRWRSEGWLLLGQGQCGTVVPGDLTPGSYYYLYASNKEEDQIWQGEKGDQWFCINPEEDFRLTFTGDRCPEAENVRRIFWEVQVKGKSHTENLVD